MQISTLFSNFFLFKVSNSNLPFLCLIDDEPIITAEEELIRATADTSRPTVTSSIDGNVQLEAPAQASALPGIRINISKALAPVEPTPTPVPHLDSLEDVSADEEPPPPGEETEPEYKVKATLEGVVFSRQLPKQKGTELSALCSIMWLCTLEVVNLFNACLVQGRLTFEVNFIFTECDVLCKSQSAFDY